MARLVIEPGSPAYMADTLTELYIKWTLRGPTKGVNPKNSGISKLLKYYVVGTLNLCQEMPEPMQKESAQSDHCAGRKRSNVPKYWDILEFAQISKI
jgi:hypothetical protein